MRYSHRMGYGIGGVCFLLCCVIYKCNNFPLKYLPPPPKIYLTLFALPYILGVKGDRVCLRYMKEILTQEIYLEENLVTIIKEKNYENGKFI